MRSWYFSAWQRSQEISFGAGQSGTEQQKPCIASRPCALGFPGSVWAPGGIPDVAHWLGDDAAYPFGPKRDRAGDWPIFSFTIRCGVKCRTDLARRRDHPVDFVSVAVSATAVIWRRTVRYGATEVMLVLARRT